MKKILIILLILLIQLCYAQAPIVPKDKLEQYTADINNVLYNILYKKNTDNKTYRETIEELYKTSQLSYKNLLLNKEDTNAINSVKYSFATMSTFQEDICGEFNNILYDKYNLDYYDDFTAKNLNCTYYIADNFLKPYKIKDTKAYIKLIKTIDIYLHKMYKMQARTGIL